MKKVLKIFGLVLLGIIVFCILIFVLVYFLTAGSQEIAKDFAHKMTQGNPDAVRALMHPALIEVIEGTPTNAALGKMCPLNDISFTSLSSSTDEGDQLAATLTLADGSESEMTLSLTSHEGVMKIYKFNIHPFCEAER